MTTPLTARIANGTPRGERTTLSAEVPSQQARATSWRTRRAGSLLSEGYRYAVASNTAYHCTKPDGTVYTVDVVHGHCDCPATVRCSHLELAERISLLCATHEARIWADWFTINCPTCGGPAWTRSARVGGGNYITLSVCPMGCDGRRMEATTNV